jgi:hypothetical protein
LNSWTSPYGTWYIYHGTWAHLNGVLHKSLLAVCGSVCMYIVVRQRLCKHVPAATNTRNNRIAFPIRSVFYKRKICVSVYPPVAARQWLRKHIPAVRKNCCSCHFLCSILLFLLYICHLYCCSLHALQLKFCGYF